MVVHVLDSVYGSGKVWTAFIKISYNLYQSFVSLTVHGLLGEEGFLVTCLSFSPISYQITIVNLNICGIPRVITCILVSITPDIVRLLCNSKKKKNDFIKITIFTLLPLARGSFVKYKVPGRRVQ